MYLKHVPTGSTSQTFQGLSCQPKLVNSVTNPIVNNLFRVRPILKLFLIEYSKPSRHRHRRPVQVRPQFANLDHSLLRSHLIFASFFSSPPACEFSILFTVYSYSLFSN
ncbi:hypothetical protein ACN38_g7017 [Penicillium nordicum]|uniref:Uncharacterized protein n=1 Tax=Penicillium nordicum TaxID=229535 RepID=A0A0M9WER9_9EURO|nr:hypothetical protein ACN38_g7017 [Penicillium nordicum]